MSFRNPQPAGGYKSRVGSHLAVLALQAGFLIWSTALFAGGPLAPLAARIWTPPVKGPVHFFEFS